MINREKEIQEALSKFATEELKKTENMTQMEENEYIKKEKKNEQIKEIIDNINKKYENTE